MEILGGCEKCKFPQDSSWIVKWLGHVLVSRRGGLHAVDTRKWLGSLSRRGLLFRRLGLVDHLEVKDLVRRVERLEAAEMRKKKRALGRVIKWKRNNRRLVKQE